ncbi:MAG TPA: ATP-binding protein [Candidatus Obscuribacterales bacterium]
MTGQEILYLLESTPPSSTEIDFQLSVLTNYSSKNYISLNFNRVIEESLLRCSIFISIEPDQAEYCSNQLRLLLGCENYQHLVTLLAYIRTCHVWMEAHPEVSYEADKRVTDYLAILIEEEPGLADFFQNHVERVNRQRLTKNLYLSQNEKLRLNQSQDIPENVQLIQAINSASEGVVITDPNQPDHPIIYSNPAFSRITGYEKHEILGHNCRFLQGPNTDPQTVDMLRISIAEAREVTVTLLNYRKDGQPFWNELKISPVFSDEGKLIYFVGIQADITYRVQAATELHNLLKEEKELSEMKSRFVTMTNHEFRTPLSTILSSAEILEHFHSQISGEQRLKHLCRIQQAVIKMVQMLDEVMEISKGEAGKIKLNPTLFDLKELCNNLVENQQLIADNKQQIVFKYLGAKRKVIMDENLLQHILNNLLSNAIKYSPTEGAIEFEVTCSKLQATFVIKDSGIGIPAADQAKLFELFYRAGNVGTIPGTGLGLAIVKRMIDLHQGSIDVESEMGVGTKFTVKIPLSTTKMAAF